LPNSAWAVPEEFGSRVRTLPSAGIADRNSSSRRSAVVVRRPELFFVATTVCDNLADPNVWDASKLAVARASPSTARLRLSIGVSSNRKPPTGVDFQCLASHRTSNIDGGDAYDIDKTAGLYLTGFLAHPVGFEPTASAFGEWIIGFAETIQFYPIARYATDITKQI
jgi:hypothetical protein